MESENVNLSLLFFIFIFFVYILQIGIGEQAERCPDQRQVVHLPATLNVRSRAGASIQKKNMWNHYIPTDP